MSDNVDVGASDPDAGAPPADGGSNSPDAGASSGGTDSPDGGSPPGGTGTDPSTTDPNATDPNATDPGATDPDDCGCTFCNADSQAAVARGSQDTNASPSPDRSPCLPDGPLQAFTISNLRPFAGKLLAQLSVRAATWQFQPAIIAANAAGFVVGIGPGVDFGVLHGWSGGGGYYFAPGNVVGIYGTWAEDDGLFAGVDGGLSFTVIHGMDNLDRKSVV